jgi:hypothetical protein
MSVVAKIANALLKITVDVCQTKVVAALRVMSHVAVARKQGIKNVNKYLENEIIGDFGARGDDDDPITDENTIPIIGV